MDLDKLVCRLGIDTTKYREELEKAYQRIEEFAIEELKKISQAPAVKVLEDGHYDNIRFSNRPEVVFDVEVSEVEVEFKPEVEIIGEEVIVDEDKLKEGIKQYEKQLEDYTNDLKRYLVTHYGVPRRIFEGKEESIKVVMPDGKTKIIEKVGHQNGRDVYKEIEIGEPTDREPEYGINPLGPIQKMKVLRYDEDKDVFKETGETIGINIPYAHGDICKAHDARVIDITTAKDEMKVYACPFCLMKSQSKGKRVQEVVEEVNIGFLSDYRVKKYDPQTGDIEIEKKEETWRDRPSLL